MLKIINYTEKELWDSIILKFSNYDIYYTYYYVISLMSHGDGIPKLIYYENYDLLLCYVVIQKDISDDSKFHNLEKNKYFDWETPYGYGGPLYEGQLNENNISNFYQELKKYCIDNGIVSQFVRFNPLIQNNFVIPSVINYKYFKKTIYIDTTNEDIINNNLDSKCKNLIRKAKKNNIKIIIASGNNYKDFISLYNATMSKDNALDYYYFDNEYYDILSNLKSSEMIFYAIYEDKPIAASIMLQINGTMHYHLSGSNYEYRNLCPTHLLLYEAALWCAHNNIKKFHLGGGLGIGNDGLFHFKSQFNKNGEVDFYLGRTIFDENIYKFLCKKRIEDDPDFDVNNSFMIQYRK